MTSPHASRSDLGDEIRRRRKARKLTQANLAKAAAIATTNVGKAEKGQPVSPTTMRAIARALDLPAELVAPFVGEPDPQPLDWSAPEPAPQDYPDEHEYMSAVYWYLRKTGMSHEAVMRGFSMAAAIYTRRQAESNPQSTPRDKLG